MKLIVLAVLVGCALAHPRNIQRIVGGEPTTVEEYPFMANMQFLWYGIFWSQSCGGSLLTSTAILSAAHCFSGSSASSWRARLGTSDASTGGTVHTFTQLINHPQYDDDTIDCDVGIAKLASPAVYSPTISPCPIGGKNYKLADDTDIIAIGWGTLWSGGPSPTQLQHVVIKVINWEICRQRYQYLDSISWSNVPPITTNMMCTGILDEGGKDACQGDSGGPVVHNNGQQYVQVGAVSWGYGCADATYPGIVADVSELSDWIAANA